MTEVEWKEPESPSPRAVKLGRVVFCFVGAVLLAIGGGYSYNNPNQHVLLSATVIGAGLLCVWLGLALPPKLVANFGFWLPWFLPGD